MQHQNIGKDGILQYFSKKKGNQVYEEVRTESMDRINAIGVDTSESLNPFESEDASKGNRELRDSTIGPLATEKVFQMVTSQLGEMGYHCSSIEKSEDFTERIDGVLTKQMGSGDPETSGYPRILTVYRVGGKIHVELYNFLKKFPTDNQEMNEVKQAIDKLFHKNHSVKLEIHE
jgi:hypothetical protein